MFLIWTELIRYAGAGDEARGYEKDQFSES